MVKLRWTQGHPSDPASRRQTLKTKSSQWQVLIGWCGWGRVRDHSYIPEFERLVGERTSSFQRDLRCLVVSWGYRTRSVPLDMATHSRANAESLGGASLILHLHIHVSTVVVLSTYSLSRWWRPWRQGKENWSHGEIPMKGPAKCDSKYHMTKGWRVLLPLVPKWTRSEWLIKA